MQNDPCCPPCHGGKSENKPRRCWPGWLRRLGWLAAGGGVAVSGCCGNDGKTTHGPWARGTKHCRLGKTNLRAVAGASMLNAMESARRAVAGNHARGPKRKRTSNQPTAPWRGPCRRTEDGSENEPPSGGRGEHAARAGVSLPRPWRGAMHHDLVRKSTAPWRGER